MLKICLMQSNTPDQEDATPMDLERLRLPKIKLKRGDIYVCALGFEGLKVKSVGGRDKVPDTTKNQI